MSDTDNRTGVTVMVAREQRAWLYREAASRAVENGQRISVSGVVRALIDEARAQRPSGQAA